MSSNDKNSNDMNSGDMNSDRGGSNRGGSNRGGSDRGGKASQQPSQDADPQRGLQPAIAAPCREALRELLPSVPLQEASTSQVALDHVAQCAFCSARLRASASLAEWVDVRPAIPAALGQSVVLEGIYSRFVESTEQGPIGAWLEQGSVTASDQVLSVTEQASGAHRDELLREFLCRPAQPDPQVWSGVRRSILEEVASERVIRRRMPMKLGALLAGAAAIAFISLLTFPRSEDSVPTITFADLDRAPDVDFAVVRYGARR